MDQFLNPERTSELWEAVKNQVSLAGGLPSGCIVIWSGAITEIPDGWVLCDGSNGTPDLRNRFVLGAGSSYKVGATGGETTHRLTVSEMPAHTHTFTCKSASSSVTDNFSTSGSKTNNNSATVTTSSAGGGSSHNNMPPYYALCYIMKL